MDPRRKFKSENYNIKLRGKHSANFLTLDLAMDSQIWHQKEKQRKKKTDKLIFIKIKNICASKNPIKGLPWWSSIRSPPANAEHVGLVPGPGRFHMPRGTKPRSYTSEPTCPQPMLHNERSHRNEKSTHCTREKPPLTTRGKAHELQLRPGHPKINAVSKRTLTRNWKDTYKMEENVSSPYINKRLVSIFFNI